MNTSLLAALAALGASEDPIVGIDAALVASVAAPKAKWRFYAPVNIGRAIFPNGQSLAAQNGVFYTNDPTAAMDLRARGYEEIQDVPTIE